MVQALVAAGGRLIDTASTYGDAEPVMGAVVAAAAWRDRMFIATKLESPDAAELKRSLARLQVARVDLLQLHNVRDARQSLAQFRAWKAQGLCRYVGITSTYRRQFDALEAVLVREKPDFVQISYSLDDREAAAAHPAAGGRRRRRGADGASLRPRPAVPRGARQADPRLGGRLRGAAGPSSS